MNELIKLITEYGRTKHEKYFKEQKQGQFNTTEAHILTTKQQPGRVFEFLSHMSTAQKHYFN
jgi:hypothetical protein